MKKFLAILASLTIVAGTMPATIAGAADAEVQTLILEEDGKSLVNGEGEYSQGTSYTEVSGNVNVFADSVITSNGAMYEVQFTDYSGQYISYYPDLDAGTYKVSYFVPAIDYRAGLTFIGSAEYAEAVSDDMGSGQFKELGNFTFTGVPGEDCIKVVPTGVEDGYNAYFDALKFELVEAAAPELPEKTEKVGVVNTLVMDAVSGTVVNGAAAEGYGAAIPVGTSFEELETETDGNGKVYYKHGWMDDYSKSMRYYPVLNAGEYKVSMYVPTRGWQASLMLEASDGKESDYYNWYMDQGLDGPGEFVDMGTYTFTGEYGKDSIKLIQKGGYNSGWTVCYGALKFERVNPLTENAGVVNSLVFETNGDTVVNDVTAAGYGSVVPVGTSLAELETETDGNGKVHYKHSWTDDYSKSMKYYPILNAGEYKVSMYVPKRGWQATLKLKASDGKENDYYNWYMDQGLEGPGEFVDMGTYLFTGVYGEDYIELIQRGGPYNTGWTVCYGALKFEKVNPIVLEPGIVNSLVLSVKGETVVNETEDSGYGSVVPVGTSFAELNESTDANGNTYYRHNWTEDYSKSMKYYPVLNAGEYKVSIYIPKTGWQAGLEIKGSDGNSYKPWNGSMDSGNDGPGEFVEIGTFDFIGEYGEDYIELIQRGGPYNTGWNVCYGGVKFERVNSIVLNPGTVKSLVVEANGDTVVNGAPEAGYATTEPCGTTFDEMEKVTDANGKVYYRHNWTEDYSKSMKYYPVLNPGEYTVSIYIPKRDWQVSFEIKGSDGTSYKPWNGDMDAGREGPGEFVEVGNFTFTGEYGKDYIELMQRGGYSTGWNVCYSAIKFEKPNYKVAEWGLDNAEGSEKLGKYTWTVEKGESVNTSSDGFKAMGWSIERPTKDNDSEATGSTGAKIAIPEGLYNTTDFTINLWVRNNGLAWHQNILEIYQADQQYRWANVRFANNVLEGHMRSGLGSNSAGETINDKTSVDAGSGEWHMVTLVVDNNTSTWSTGAIKVDYFYDGVKIGGRSLDNDQGKWKNYLDENTFIYIGAEHNGVNRFNGAIDEISLYNIALTEDDIAEVYSSEAQVVSAVTDGIAMADAKTLGDNNTITLDAPQVPESDTAFEKSATVNGVFAGELVYINGIPEGLYVSNVKAAEEKIVVSFAGRAAESVAIDKYLGVTVMAYGENTANSNKFVVTVETVYGMSVSEIKSDNGVFNVSVRNNSWDYSKPVDFVVAIYEEDGRMRDVFYHNDLIPEPSGSIFTVTTDVLDYAEGNVVKVFIFESIDTLKPINVYHD